MTKYFNKAIEEYRKVICNKLISPISNKDSLIIELVLERLRQLGEKELFTYLKSNWKFLKDEEVLNEVQNIVSGLDDKVEEEQKEDKEEQVIQFIEFENKIIEIDKIQTIGWEDDWNEETFKIIINKLPIDSNITFLTANLIFEFKEMEERDLKLSILKETLKDLRNVKITKIDGKETVGE